MYALLKAPANVEDEVIVMYDERPCAWLVP